MKNLLALVLLLSVPTLAHASDNMCWLVSSVAAADISGGTATTAEIKFIPGSTLPSATVAIPTYLKVQVVVVDANAGISKIRLTFTSTEAAGGTYGNTPLCADAAPVLTCGQVKVDWDPQTDGKVYWLKPIDWGWPYGKITATATGAGANDTIAYSIYGCHE